MGKLHVMYLTLRKLNGEKSINIGVLDVFGTILA